ncbi:MAG: alpha/beta hydrolase [Rhodobacteraceae bacterium]|nr:alpha/beta hydrolase [Paracoccaceae bacterium]
MINLGLPNARPDLPERFQCPDRLTWGEMRAADGAALRYARLSGPAALHTVIVLPGFAEFIEKYFETARDLAARNCDVWLLDWRGQGDSDGRYFRPTARDFNRDAADLTAFVAGIVKADRPPIAVAHSMGGAIALKAMTRNGSLFAGMALSAPMLGLPLGPLPSGLVRFVTAGAVKIGLGSFILPGTRMWPPDPGQSPATSKTTSDPARSRVMTKWQSAHENLRLAGVTLVWADAALAFCASLNRPQVLASISVPILMAIAGREFFVDPDALRRAARALPRCRVVEFPGAKHELFMESDAIRTAWIDAIADFIADSNTAVTP